MRKAIHSRDDLIDVIRGRCPLTSCNRAIDSGEVLVLGGFAPPEGITGQPHWVLRVTSRHGRVWHVAVLPHSFGVNVKIIKEVDWKNWLGSDRGAPDIYNGDDPLYSSRHWWDAQETRDEPRPE
jgi:hypothetical protein